MTSGLQQYITGYTVVNFLRYQVRCHGIFVSVLKYVYYFIKFANSVDPDDVAHYEPPHQDLHCLQILSFLVSRT